MSYIDIIGGELFCRKDWNIILKKLVEANLMPNYISTKVPLTEEKIKLLHDTGYNNVVQISLDSLNDYILQKIIGTSIGYVQKIKNTITLLEKYGFKIQIDTILTKFNSDIKSILELFNYIKSLRNYSANTYTQRCIPDRLDESQNCIKRGLPVLPGSVCDGVQRMEGISTGIRSEAT